jgi:hypothetical protein
MFNERIKQLYEDRRMPQRKLEYNKIKRGEQVALAGNLSPFAGKQILLPGADSLCARFGEGEGLVGGGRKKFKVSILKTQNTVIYLQLNKKYYYESKIK